MEPYLLADRPLASLDEYLATETGGLGLARAEKLGPAWAVDEITLLVCRWTASAGKYCNRQ